MLILRAGVNLELTSLIQRQDYHGPVVMGVPFITPLIAENVPKRSPENS